MKRDDELVTVGELRALLENVLNGDVSTVGVIGRLIDITERLGRIEAALPPLPPYSDEPNALSVAAALQRADERLNERLGLWGKIRDWSQTTFGDGRRTKGLLEHIRRELEEVSAKPDDLVEWVDVVLLAFDGFWRHGGKPEEFLDAVRAKYEVNQARKWPPPAPEDQPNHHVKETPAPQAATTLDAVYTERNRLALVVARLAKAAGLPVACIPDPENGPDWRVLYVQFPRGQASWHIPVKDLDLGLLALEPLPSSGVKWDGHTKAQAYDRMETWAAGVELVGPEELYLLREIANAAWRWMRTESSSRPGFVEDALMHAVNALVSYGKREGLSVCDECNGCGTCDTERGGSWVTCSKCRGAGKRVAP